MTDKTKRMSSIKVTNVHYLTKRQVANVAEHDDKTVSKWIRDVIKDKLKEYPENVKNQWGDSD